MKIEADTLQPLIVDFLASFYGDETADEYQEMFGLSLSKKKLQKDPLVKAGGLTTLLQSFLK